VHSMENVTVCIFRFLLYFRLEKLIEDVEAHRNLQHLDKVCLHFYALWHVNPLLGNDR
jgi:hypothetical protein